MKRITAIRISTLTVGLTLGGLGGKLTAGANEVVDWNAAALSVRLAGGYNNVTVTRGLTMVHIAIHSGRRVAPAD